MNVYVVLLNWNGARDTITCLESVLRLQDAEFQVVVCDNGSTDDSVLRLRDWAQGRQVPDLSLSPLPPEQHRLVEKPLRMQELQRAEAEAGGDGPQQRADIFLLHTGANLGFAGGCNVGIRFALARGDADFVWLLNNDTVVDPQALAALLRRATSQGDRPGIVGSMLCYFDAPGRVQSLGGGTFNPRRAMTRHIDDGAPRPVFVDAAAVQRVESQMVYVVGASMLVSRRFLERVGTMQEDYFLYFEEIDWAERARRADPTLSLGFAPASIVYHKVGASAGTHTRSMLSMRYLTANRLRFVKRFYPAHLPVARLAVFWEGCKALIKGRSAEAVLMLRTAVATVSI